MSSLHFQFGRDQVTCSGPILCECAPAAAGEILHDLCEHAERRTIPICQTVSRTQDSLRYRDAPT